MESGTSGSALFIQEGHILSYLYPEQLTEGFDKIDFAFKQWYGVIEHFLRQDYADLTEEEINNAVYDMVNRSFYYGKPKFSELPEYIADYMNR